MPYCKLDSELLDSSIWQEDKDTKLVWITMLAAKNQHGEVKASVPGLAKRAGVSLAECQQALDKLLAPDLFSRTKDYEGRRITPIDGGWFVLNHFKFQELDGDEDRKAKAAERSKRSYHRKKVLTSDDVRSHTSSPQERHTDTDTDTDTNTHTPSQIQIVDAKPHKETTETKTQNLDIFGNPMQNFIVQQ